ncbi:MAG TPA: multifunctional oxoglutarate decarboxylase/oxoglutarate dehydrogenase thiamine pyrophosphate-binding subunit/dihydrolipoyllysine-residue succinyltransferase subunit [Chloroflexota bacterium]
MNPENDNRIERRLDEFGPNTGYVWSVLQEYIDNPSSVDPAWQEFFLDLLKNAPSPLSDKVHPAGTPGEPEPARNSLQMLRGAAARVVENMEASLSLPTATTFHAIPAKVLEENRRLANEYLRISGRGKISFTHIVSYAIVGSLKSFPNLNASFARVGGEPYRDAKEAINMGIAVDVTRRDGSRMLLVPNIKDAGTMDFASFVEAYNEVVRKTQDGTLAPADFQGTSITLTNPGTVGTRASVPRLMPGQGAIVAMGTIDYDTEKQGMAPETLASLAISKVMQLTCTYDHRVIQGAESGSFLTRIHGLLLGEDDFYQRLFADLNIPFEPWAWSRDMNPAVDGKTGGDDVSRHTRVGQLINAYRVRGHLVANTDPLVYRPQHHPELDPAYYTLTVWDLDREFRAVTIQGMERSRLRDILAMLRETYCATLGVEYMFMQDTAQKFWLQGQMEPSRNHAPLEPERKKQILRKLVAADTFEHFLHTKYIGHKRFSIEGGETFLPLLDSVLDGVAEQGGKRVVIGMAHRGRLNVLANTVGKPLGQMFNEFEENLDPMATQGTGDVKYHLGARGTYRTPSGRELLVEVAPNPSHLESVNPVVEGMVRAMQDRVGEDGKRTVVPVLVHGDAAFAGQGIVGETLNLSQLDGYRTGGTIHVVINNQIGFTTAPGDARSTPYSTDVAKMIQAPIFHVNGDDPEMAVRASRLALAFRERFHRDVVIDMVCYRKYGHNEADEPSYTQPLLYQAIKGHPAVRHLYADKLVKEGLVTEEEVASMESESRQLYERSFDEAQRKDMPFVADIPLAVSPEDVRAQRDHVAAPVTLEVLQSIAHALSIAPPGFNIHPKLARLFESRGHLTGPDARVDWALAEAFAFGTLVQDGIPVRLAGQDTARGTFSQRHAILYDAVNGAEYIPLQHLRDGQARFRVYDSLLSEAAALAFEFGYSVADPLALVLWEAQFGDFANNAQVVIDQYIASSRTRWQESSDLVLLLPHGYEGQGPEHSSARLERYLQLCAEENLTVADPSLPAQYFHLLRRHKLAGVRRPLVLMTPKSLLRHPAASSTAGDLIDGSFREVIDDESVQDPSRVRRLILCTGKIYFDAAAARAKDHADHLALVRIEQLYPFPADAVRAVVRRYPNAGLVWLQEEPKNMGAWLFMHGQLRECLGGDTNVRYVGRAAAASPATGSLKLHQQHQEAILKEALSTE